jgi:hypothetical protein
MNNEIETLKKENEILRHALEQIATFSPKSGGDFEALLAIKRYAKKKLAEVKPKNMKSDD